MSLDNSLGPPPDNKREEVDPPNPNCCSGSGEPTPVIPSTLAPAPDCKPLSSSIPMSSSFQHRPFPPPSLASVPVEYIIDQLHTLAPHYWNKPETADCTIIVPIPYARGPIHPSIAAHFPPNTSSSATSLHDTSRLGRRATQPALNLIPRISLKLHVDYLSAHSSYLRSLFSGASALDLSQGNSTPTFNAPSSGFTIPANRLPRLMPCSPNHPVLLLPVPDPTSFHLLVHWMYFGDTTHIEDCLMQGIIQWEGIARNVEYLGLSTDIKVFLGKWYGCWLHPERARGCSYSDDSESDTAYSEYGSDDESDTASDMDEDEESEDEKEITRGRTRVTRPLSFQDPNTFTQPPAFISNTSKSL